MKRIYCFLKTDASHQWCISVSKTNHQYFHKNNRSNTCMQWERCHSKWQIHRPLKRLVAQCFGLMACNFSFLISVVKKTTKKQIKTYITCSSPRQSYQLAFERVFSSKKYSWCFPRELVVRKNRAKRRVKIGQLSHSCLLICRPFLYHPYKVIIWQCFVYTLLLKPIYIYRILIELQTQWPQKQILL